jgi:hypothetical protein
MFRIAILLQIGRALIRLGLCALVIVSTGCYVGPGAPLLYSSDDGRDHVYKLYPGPERPQSELATVRLESAYYAQIDGLLVDRGDYEQVLLLPGEHEIHWGQWFAVSVLVDPDMFSEGSHTAVVNLQAGHTYELHADRTTGRGYRKYFWMTDAASGDVVAGEEKP